MKKILVFIDKFIGAVLMYMLLSMVTTLLLSVFFRYVRNRPIFWIDEIIRYLLVWMTFLGMGHVIKNHKHIVVDFINVFIPPKAGKILDIFVDVIIFGFSLILIYYGFIVTVDQLVVRSAAFAWLRYGHLYAAIPIGCAVGLAYLVREFPLHIKALKSRDLNKSEVSE